MKEKVLNLRRYLMTGVSYMLPFIVGGGLLIAFGTIFGRFGFENVMEPMQKLGYAIFGFIPHIIGAYIAFGIADRPGIAPGFAGGYVAAEIGSGFLGGIFAGLIAGFVVEILKKVPFHPYIITLKSMMVIPFIGMAVTGGLVALIGVPISLLQNFLDNWLIEVSGSNAILLGAILGAMLAFDMGGPINKIALTFIIGAYSQQIFEPNAAAFAGIMTPPISAALASFIAPNKFTKVEKANSLSALFTGLLGITEGAIPYATSNPIRVIPAFVIGSAVGGASIMAFDIETKLFGGILAFPFTERWYLFLLSLIIGIAISTGLLILFKKNVSEELEKEGQATV